MQITRKNPFNPEQTRTRDIPVKASDYMAWERGEGLIQNLMPYLSADDREFIMTGILPDEWENLFKET